MLPENEILALLNLIDDPDEIVFSQIREKILSIGPEIVPDLERAWSENKYDQDYLLKIENLIHDIQFQDVADGLKNWKNNGFKDVLEGALLINKYRYPDLDRKVIYDQLSIITQDAKLSINEFDTGLEKIVKLNTIFFQVHGFLGNRKDYYSPTNSYLSEVISSKKGNALMLSLIYLEVANRLNIPLKGINLPNHFILGYEDKNAIGKEFGEQNHGFLFYLNVFSGGEILHRHDIDLFLDRIKIDREEKFYQACTNLDIIKRILTNLSYSYLKLEENTLQQEIELLKSIIS